MKILSLLLTLFLITGCASSNSPVQDTSLSDAEQLLQHYTELLIQRGQFLVSDIRTLRNSDNKIISEIIDPVFYTNKNGEQFVIFKEVKKNINIITEINLTTTGWHVSY